MHCTAMYLFYLLHYISQTACIVLQFTDCMSWIAIYWLYSLYYISLIGCIVLPFTDCMHCTATYWLHAIYCFLPIAYLLLIVFLLLIACIVCFLLTAYIVLLITDCMHWTCPTDCVHSIAYYYICFVGISNKQQQHKKSGSIFLTDNNKNHTRSPCQYL